jgi:translocation and assembly module TamB
MEEKTDIKTTVVAARGRRWTYWIFGTASAAALALLGVAYWQRTTIADRYVQAQLKKYGVQARYKITDIGLRTQRLEDVVIGNPDSPDLTVKVAEIDLSINFDGATLRDVRASGVQLNGRFDGKKISFGALDKFKDPKNNKPFEIPDIGLKLSNAGVHMDMPYGVIDAKLDGYGLLRQRFEGNLTLQSPQLSYNDCLIKSALFEGKYIFDSRRPNIIGPLSADTVSCKNSDMLIAAPLLKGDVRLSEKFDRWFGDINFSANGAQINTMAFTLPRGLVQFDGGRARTNFDVKLSGAGYQGSPLSVRNIALSAVGNADINKDGFSIAARGDAVLTGSTLDRAYLTAVNALASKGRTTPLGPLLIKMASALGAATSNFDGTLQYDGKVEAGGKAIVSVGGLEVSTRSGARASQSGTLQLNKTFMGWDIMSPVNLALSGGGLPAAKVRIQRGKGSAWAGELVSNEYTAGGARLAVPKLSFAGQPGGAWRFNGQALLTGPLQGGYVNNLKLPIDARWDGRNIAMYQSCQSVAFDRLKYADTISGKQNVRICPDGNAAIFQAGAGGTRVSANVANFAFNGSFAGQKVKARSSNIRFNLAQGFVASNIDAEYGTSPIRVRTPTLRFNFGKGFTTRLVQVDVGKTKFDVAAINGRMDQGGLKGSLDGANGVIANVPLILSKAGGLWYYRNGTLGLSGSVQVSDAEQVSRFLPINVPDASVTLRNGIITAQGGLFEPVTGRKLSGADIRHMLSTGTGKAVLSVNDLKFDDILQPEMITPLTKGVIAYTRGTINGAGYINWGPQGVTSNGKFKTESLDVAATLGPVEKIQTEIEFTDLMALETKPGQVADIGSINPGIAALDGKVRYQLLPGKRVGIEGGRWPFAGGELILEPTVIDFAIESERRITLRVVGMDASKFLQQYDFDNLQVSGIFDGTLPMVFNQQGGRIVGGNLVARSGGGEVNYVGQVSYENMGYFANYAFGALRSIRYNNLTIGINGDLGGEIITEVGFSGVQQGAGAKRNFITKQLAKIPLQFNIRISAQFLQLIGSIRGIYDAKYASEKYGSAVLNRKITAEPINPVTTKNPIMESKPKDE